MTTEDEVKTEAGTTSADTPKSSKSKGKSDKKASAKKADASKPKGKDASKKDGKKPAAKATEKKAATKVVVEKDVFGFRKGSKKSQAAALYNSKKGATLAEVKEKTGSSQLNLLTELEGRVTIDTTKEKGAGKKQVTRYKITIPEGGVKAAKPAKKEDKAKPAKAAAKSEKKADAKKAPAKADKKAAKPAKKAKAEAQASA